MTDLRSRLQQTLGASYTIDRELGGGGMSRVFVAEEHALGRSVVVKILPPDLVADVNVDRFKREIQLSAKLQHPHIVPVLTTGEIADVQGRAGLPYYTMPFVDGESLRGRLARVGALAITEAVGVLRDIAKALAYAHEHGVVHRDIKPDNVLLSGGSATVADFGIAKAISAARGESAGGTLTQVGTSLGTPAYMAPEQVAADPSSNHRSDIYSFGCVAYEVLTGRAPFAGKTPQRLLAAQMSEKPQPVLELRADVPKELADLVMRCLEKDADDRPQRAADIVRVLETVTSGGGHAALAPVLLGGAGMFRRALMYYAAAFVVVIIVVQAAVIAIGLPDWVLAGAIAVMLLGLPVILFTGYAQRVTRRAVTMTPTFTPGGTPSLQHGTLANLAIQASPHMSWHRAAKGGAYAFGTFVVLVAGFMLLRATGVGPFGTLLASGQLRDRDPLLLTDFRVVNGDSTLGPVISRAVRSNLEQSRVLAVVSPGAVADALQRMQRLSSSRLDLALARELGAREGIRAIVDGEVAGIGSGFLVTLRLVTTDSARELASFRQAADGPTQLIEAVDVLSRKLRDRVGESLKEVRNSPPLAQVTTASLDALRKYTEAIAATATSDFDGAARLAREAIALDSGFALAYRHLFESLFNIGMVGPASDSAITRAFQLQERLTERERLAVLGDYYTSGPTPDRARAIDAFTRQLDMGEHGNTNSLAELHETRRELARAVELTQLRLRVDPTNALSYGNMAGYFVEQGNLAAADSILAVAAQRGIHSPHIAMHRARVMVARDSLWRAHEITDSLRGAVRGTYNLRAKQALAFQYVLQGQIAQGERMRAEHLADDRARGNPAMPVRDTVRAVYRDAWLFGPAPSLMQRLNAAVAAAPLAERNESALDLARTYAFLGAPARARSLLSAWEGERRDSVMRRLSVPQVQLAQAEIALAERRYADAVALFRKADTVSDGPVSACASCLPANLGRTFDLAGQRDSAILAFEKAVVHARLSPLEAGGALLLPAIEQRLGELYEAAGDRQKAYAHYERFTMYWKDADPVLRPRVADVRRRMARLGDIERK